MGVWSLLATSIVSVHLLLMRFVVHPLCAAQSLLKVLYGNVEAVLDSYQHVLNEEPVSFALMGGRA